MTTVMWLTLMKRSIHWVGGGALEAMVNVSRQPCKLCGRQSFSTQETDEMKFSRLLEVNEKQYNAYKSAVKSLAEDDLSQRYRNLKALKVVNYDSTEALPLFTKHPFTIRNRVHVLLESGFTESSITTLSITKYLMIMKQNVTTLKNLGYIPANIDVMSHILKHVDLEPQFYPQEMLERSTSLLALRKAVLRAFFKRKFGVTDQEMKDKGQNITRLWNKSFDVINQNIRMMESVVGIPTQTLRNHLYLLALNPENTETILREVRQVGDIDILTALKARPKIMSNTCGNLNRILQLLKDYKIPNKFNHSALKLFTLSYDTIKRRLEELNEIEYFAINREHPRILVLIMHQEAAKRRLRLLEQSNLHPASLHLIVTKNSFEKFLSDGYRHTTIFDVMRFLSNQFNCRPAELRNRLHKNPFWTTVSLVVVARNTKFLLLHLSNENILKSPLVLFYPSDKVKEEFFKLESREGIEDCRGPDGRVRADLIPSLITYFLEREENFSLHGVWAEQSSSEPIEAPHILQSCDSIS